MNALGAREEGVAHCPKCGLYAEAHLKKDKHGRIWTITLTEKPVVPVKPKSSEWDSFIYIIWIMMVLFLFLFLVYLTLYGPL